MKTEIGKFKKLTKKYFDSLMRIFPEYGSFLGLQKYDGLWSKESKKSCLLKIKFFKNYLKNFQKIKSEKLTAKENLDKKIIIHELKNTIFSLEKIRIWESDPDIAENIGSMLFVLLSRQASSRQKLSLVLNKAVAGISPLFEQVKTRISNPYKLWTEIAIDSCFGLKMFLESLNSFKIEYSLKDDFQKNLKAAIKAIDSYIIFLRREILPKAKNKYSIGNNKFKELIKIRELNLKIEEMLEIGRRALEVDKEELKEIAREISPNFDVKQAKKKITKKHLKDFKEILKQYGRVVKKARDFLAEHNLVELPKNEEVIIRETPSFLAHTTPFAAYFPPAKFSKKQLGIYVVTPPLQKGTLEKHNYTSIFNTSVHEAYPGHHLQLTAGFRNPSLVRTLANATEMVEGWAFYCEEYMRDVGFNNTPETRFVQTLDEIWRAARVVIDIKLQTGKMSFKEAVDFLIKQTGMEKGNAVAEVKRYTKNPSYQLSYLVGKYLIKKLKREIQEKMEERYSDRFFHETILKAGGIPVKYLREEFDLKIRNIVPIA